MKNDAVRSWGHEARDFPDYWIHPLLARPPRRAELILLLALGVVLSGVPLLWAQPPLKVPPQRVLLLNSYHQGYLWTDEITRGVEETFGGADVELHIEYMDTKRQFDPAYQALLRQMLHHKHRRHRYAVVIASDNNAFDFMKEQGRSIFGSKPVVFCGVNYLQPSDIQGLDTFTGVNEQMNIAGNVELIKRLHPELTKIVVITDNTTTGKKNQQEVRRIDIRAIDAMPRIELLYDLSVDALTTRMQDLDDGTAVLFTIFIRDRNDVFVGYEQGLKLVCENARVPVYATQNFRTGPCVVGGYLTSGYDQGVVAAEKARAILNGKPVAEIPIHWDTPTRARFDYRNLKRHGISFDRLPPGSEILHQPVSFYYQHKHLIRNTAVVFCLLLLALCGVIYGLIRSRQAAGKLLRNEENLRTTLDSIGDAVIATDTSGRIARMNPVAERLTGWRAGEAVGRPIDEVFNIVHALTGSPAQNPVLRVMETGKITGLTNQAMLIAKDGTQYQIADSAAPIKASDGTMTGAVLVFRDVSEAYAKDRQLRESERKYRQLIENANDAVFITQDGWIKYANRKTSKIIGYSEEELGAVSFVDFIHPDDRKMVMDRHRRRLRGETGIPSTYCLRVYNRDGKELIAQLSVAVIEWNTKPAILNFMRDITDQRKLEAGLQRAHKMEAIGTLAGGIAHDFNNLLMGIQGRASLMAFDLQAVHPHQEHIQAIGEYVRSATNLTRQLLGVGRGGKYEPKPNDLNGLVTNSSSMFNRTRKEIQVRLKLSAEPIVADVDRQQIEQVLLNIYVNAWQAMPDGGELLITTDLVFLGQNACEPHAVRPGSYARIAVRDTGVGMSAAIRDKIFDPFFSTKAKGRGTGLGLASAYGIIKNHDGFITVHSEPGQGSTFNIYLPSSYKRVARRASAEEAVISGTETILLVDDEVMIIAVGRAILEKLGYRVLVAHGGKQALAAIEAEGKAIDLVILDLIMPGLDGGQTFDHIRALVPEMPVILASGYAINGQASDIMQRGCNGFLQKPFSVAQLSKKVRQVLDEARVN